VFRAGLLVVAAGLGLLVGAGGVPLSAQAHQDCVARYYLGISRGVACNRYPAGGGNHYQNWVDGCDRDADGLKVRAWATLVEVSGDLIGDWDPNGANPGCANDQYIVAHLARQRICVEQPVGCSDWLNHGYP
jgi:hypothetical protein